MTVTEHKMTDWLTDWLTDTEHKITDWLTVTEHKMSHGITAWFNVWQPDFKLIDRQVKVSDKQILSGCLTVHINDWIAHK